MGREREVGGWRERRWEVGEGVEGVWGMESGCGEVGRWRGVWGIERWRGGRGNRVYVEGGRRRGGRGDRKGIGDAGGMELGLPGWGGNRGGLLTDGASHIEQNRQIIVPIERQREFGDLPESFFGVLQRTLRRR